MSHKPLMQYPNVDCPECDGKGNIGAPIDFSIVGESHTLDIRDCDMCEGSGRVGVVEAAEWYGAEFVDTIAGLEVHHKNRGAFIDWGETKEVCAIKYLEWLNA